MKVPHLRSTGSATRQHQLMQREQGPLLSNVLPNLLAMELQRQHFQASTPRCQSELNVPADSAGVGIPTNPVGRFRMPGMLGIKLVILSADAQPNRRNSPGQLSMRRHGSQSHSPTCRSRQVAMPVPDFDRYGLLPGGVHGCTMEEVEAALAWNEQRRQLTSRLREFITNEVSTRFVVIPPVVLDGSYVTAKEKPSDINLILELHELPDLQKMQAVDLCQRRPEILLRYQIDLNTALQPSGKNFVAYFSSLDPREAIAMNLYHDHKKGLLRLR